MDTFVFLCGQQLMEDMLDTDYSSDEKEQSDVNMNVFKSLCTLNVIDDLDDSCTSSDENDINFNVLAYAELLKKTKNFRRTKRRNVTSLKDNRKRTTSRKKSNINLIYENKARRLNKSNGISETSIIQSNGTKSSLLIKVEPQDNPLENNGSNSSAKYDLKLNCLSDCDKTNSDEKAELRSVLSLLVQEQKHFDESILDSLSENEFRKFFHISRKCVTYMIEIFYSWYRQSHNKEINSNANTKTNLLPFLWFCANPVRFENVAEIFNTPLEEIKQQFNVILNFFEDILPEHIKLPNLHREKESLVKDFEKIDGFPNVLGCLVQSSFTCHNDLLQNVDSSKIYIRGIFDSRKKFLNLKVCLPQESNVDEFLEKDLPNLCFPKYHLLGDEKFPIRHHLIKPFINTENLTETEKWFNIKFQQTYDRVDSVFDAIRSRFRQVNCLLSFNSIETIFKFIVACCIIHNICIDNQDVYNDKTGKFKSSNDVSVSLASAKPDNFLSDFGMMKRYELSQILFKMKK